MNSIGMLTLLAIYRCIIVAMPHHAGKINSRGAAAALQGLSWAFAAGTVLPANFGWAYYRQECIGIRYTFV